MGTVGEYIKHLRLQAGLDKKELAHMCGWANEGKLNQYEKNSKKVTPDDAIALAFSLGVTPAELLADSPDNTEYVSFKCIPIPIVGEVYKSKLTLNDYVLTAEGAFAEAKYYNLIPSKRYALKISENLRKELNDGDVLIFDSTLYPSANGDIVLTRNGINDYSLKKLYTNEFGTYDLVSLVDTHLMKRLKPDISIIIATMVCHTKLVDNHMAR
ncbi:XRE family transcriptional regulator [Yersinia intermedia]|uniref:helix-turn-helix domain-containing protein n=1 Tax=Yersinia intermedia TaxID=631 RepID=UPI0005E8E395|nr:helix-turn-helix transcriptional regulator [Yersinia intermedia]CND05462.1 XRE family transcriptional regulator [Yersinia intermedia]CNH33316.1 XRE family transcriptional regulator [Yersinia intermedia]